MGKVTKARSPSKPATTGSLAPEVLQQVSSLRTAGSGAFLKKDFAKAAEAYEAAAKLLPDGAPEKAELLNKKIGCLLGLKKWKEAAKDASTVLELSPTSAAALKSRAKANEQLGFLTKALSDVQAVNRTESATVETREMEVRLRDLVSGKSRPSSAPASSAVAQPAAVNHSSASPRQEVPLVIKATLGSSSKLIYTSFTVGYLELLDQVRQAFPSAGPVMLKYVDKDGDQIIISSRNDVQVALSDMVHLFQKHMAALQGKMTMPPHLPPVKIVVVPVASEADVPRPPAAEMAERGQTTGVQEMQEQYQPEEWITSFARLVLDLTNIDSTSHFEHINLAGDKLQRAVQQALQSEDAEPIFKEAEDHFRDAIASSYVQWGNVFLSKADVVLHKLADRLPLDSPEWEGSEELKTALGLFDKVEEKIQEALKINPNSYEAVSSLGQLEFERAKAKIGYVMPAQPASEEEGASKTPEEIQAGLNKQLTEVLAKLDPKKVIKAQPHIDKCNEIYERAKAMAKSAWEAKTAKDAERAAKDASKAKAAESKESKGEAATAKPAEAAEPVPPPFSSPPSSMMVMHGNMLYDWSNVLSGTGAAPWRPVLDAAAVMFRASGAPEADVRVALKNHLRVAELDLGPDPEPQAPATPAAKEAAPAPAPEKKAAAHAPEAKGLPSLDIKKKPAAPAAAATAAAAAK